MLVHFYLYCESRLSIYLYIHRYFNLSLRLATNCQMEESEKKNVTKLWDIKVLRSGLKYISLCAHETLQKKLLLKDK